VGLDTITYVIPDVCPASGFVVTIDGPPDPGTIVGSNSVYEWSNVTLSDVVTGGIWTTTNAAVSTVTGAGLVVGIAPGVDSIVYTVSNACGSLSTYFMFTVDAVTTGVNNIAAGISDLTVMPNPAASQFTVNVSSSFDEQATITITNMLGEKVKEFTGNTNKPIDASLDAPAGVYLLNAATAHGNMGGRIVIE
jgi:hypothetical protein